MSDPAFQLNEAQQQAVEHDAGPLIVLAGPGTGKTAVITRRIEHLITRRGCDPATIVALTFTVRAAAEMRERVAAMDLQAAAEQIQASTFHGFGLGILRRFGDMLGLPAKLTIADAAEHRRALREAAQSLPGTTIDIEGADAAADQARALATQIAQLGLSANDLRTRVAAAREALEAGDSPEDSDAKNPVPVAARRARLDRYAAYASMIEHAERDLLRRGRLTLDHLLTLPTHLLPKHPAALAMVRESAQHALVDEYQDSNPAQLAMLRVVCPPDQPRGVGPDLVVVGDDDQSIYAFRGADDRAFHHFQQAYPTAETVELVDNYRSTPAVVDIATRVIGAAIERFAPDKSLVSRVAVDNAVNVLAVHLEADRHDADVIAADILASRAKADAAGEPVRSTAVIARGHADLDRIAAALRVNGVPFRIARRQRVLELPAMQDLLAWIETLVTPDAAWPVQRLLVRPPFSVDADTVAQWHRQYRRAAGLADASRGDAPGTFTEWLEARPDANLGGLGRFVHLRTLLAERTAHVPAHEAIFEIIARGELVAAELPDSAGLVANAGALAAAVRYARDARTRMPEPRNLAAFWAHYQDLDEQGQSFGLAEEQRVDVIDGEGDEPQGDGVVQLLTAHASKGLEFDTVYVPRIGPTAGFGWVDHSTRDRPPPGVADELVFDPERQRAEQRRLFYVACTRAERRLVLLTKKAKSRSKSTHFFHELTYATPALELLDIIEASDLLAAAAGAGVHAGSTDAPDELAQLATRRDAIADARRRVRTAAARALASVDEPEASQETLREAQAVLSRAASELRALAAADRAAEVPAWLDASAKHLAEAVVDAESAGDPAPDVPRLPPMRPPLKLSYTRIQDYITCPACFYVRHVLGLSGEDSDAASVGTLVHEALAAYARRCQAADAEGVPAPTPDALRAIADSVYFESLKAGGVPDKQALARATALLDIYARELHDPNANILEIEHSARVPYVAGDHTHSLEAKIDRLDQTGAGLRIVDFKTGKASKKLTEPTGTDLQLGIYAMAVAERFPDAAGVAEYWVLSTGQRGTITLDDLKLDRVRKDIDKAIAGMLAGDWHQGKNCRCLCDFIKHRTRDPVAGSTPTISETSPSVTTPSGYYPEAAGR